MTDTARVLHTLTAYTFGLNSFPPASNPVTWDIVKDAVYEATVSFGRTPHVYGVPDRDGNGMTIIAYRHFADDSMITGVHEVWTHRDAFPRGCGADCCA